MNHLNLPRCILIFIIRLLVIIHHHLLETFPRNWLSLLTAYLFVNETMFLGEFILHFGLLRGISTKRFLKHLLSSMDLSELSLPNFFQVSRNHVPLGFEMCGWWGGGKIRWIRWPSPEVWQLVPGKNDAWTMNFLSFWVERPKNFRGRTVKLQGVCPFSMELDRWTCFRI